MFAFLSQDKCDNPSFHKKLKQISKRILFVVLLSNPFFLIELFIEFSSNSKIASTTSETKMTFNKEECLYLEKCQEIVNRDVQKLDRTKVGTYSLFGAQFRYSLRDGKPPMSCYEANSK